MRSHPVYYPYIAYIVPNKWEPQIFNDQLILRKEKFTKLQASD